MSLETWPNMKGCMAARNEPANAPRVEQPGFRTEAFLMRFVLAVPRLGKG